MRTQAAGQAMVVPEFKHVGMRLCRTVPTADVSAAAVVEALTQLGLTQVRTCFALPFCSSEKHSRCPAGP